MVSRWSYRRLCNKGTSGILQACPRKIPELLKSEKENRRGQSKREEEERSTGGASVIKEEEGET